MLLPFLALVVGLLVGAVLAWFVAGRGSSSEISAIKTVLDAALRDKQIAENSRAVLQGRIDAMEEAKRSMKETFDSLAAKALQDNNRNFLALAQLELGKQ